MNSHLEPNFKLPPSVLECPAEGHTLPSRQFQGIPSLAVSPGGRIWTTWYAGKTPAEDQNNYVVVASSEDGGQTWAERFVVDPDGEGPVRAFDPELWVDPTGRLWSFWAQAIGGQGTVAGVWAMTNDEPDRLGASWSPPIRLTDGIMMCKPIVLSSGEWLLPVSTWRETDYSAKVVLSSDQGQTWHLQGACNVPVSDRSFDEHMLVEKNDGSLWMLVRTAQGIGESFSRDRGRTWSDLAPCAILHPSSRFFIRRLASGSLLLVKHGPLREQTGRSLLTAYVSADDGLSWSQGLLLDEREDVSYPDGQQGPDAKIHIVYDRARTKDREILLCTFSETAVRVGRSAASADMRKTLVSKPPA